MRLTLATWNINSVRLRMPLVEKFLEEFKPDILCLQETKCRDSEFPSADFRRLGYGHMAINGQKGYHGVATVSRLALVKDEAREFCSKGDARHVSAKLDVGAGPLNVHNFYVPAGGDEPDPEKNEKFAHKLAFLDEMQDWFSLGSVAAERAIMVGDLNIAPLEHDVWSHKALLSVVSHTPVEVERLARVQASGPWHDALRHFVPEAEKLYTWWSYRSPDWASANKGRRLDHIWVSGALKNGLHSMQVVKEARGWERPSDHAPVMVSLEV